MSDMPCTGCRATNRGRLFFAYLNHYMGDELVKRRVRLCADCVAEMLAPVLEGADYLESGQWVTVDIRGAFRHSMSLAKHAER
jgi:hypothetical protein